MTTVSFGATIPKNGFFYVFENDEGRPKLLEPVDGVFKSNEQNGTIFLSCNVTEALNIKPETVILGSSKTEIPFFEQFGEVISKPDLYLKFLNTEFSPSSLLEFANAYGLLDWVRAEEVKTNCSEFPDIAARVGKRYWEKENEDDDEDEKYVILATEKVADWFDLQERMRLMLALWSKYDDEDIADKKRFLRLHFNTPDMAGSLSYRINIDADDGLPRSEILATGLQSALMVQWGMDITAGAEHKQCEECDSWIVVAPGKGRPEKTYCSNACSMRAYRKRKKVGKSNG